MGVRIALFGQPRVISDDESAIEYPLPRKTLNVLAYLILHRRRATARDSIAFALFPDEDEERARASLRRNLSYLLSALPDSDRLILAGGDRIAWNPDGGAHVDVIAFEEAAEQARDADAVAEYAGDLLPTIYDEWTVSDRERLRIMFHDALARTIAHQRSVRDFDAATASAHRLLAGDPWREDIVRILMAIRYEAGDRAGALAAFDRFASMLRAEMNADPMQETIAVRDAVLRGVRLATSDAPRKAASLPVEPALPFVGRGDDMERAREFWRSAADGRPSVLFVSGEAGVGKTRFATELARLTEREGASTVRGCTAAGGEHLPYEAFVDALRGAPRLLDDHAGAALTDDRAARLRLFDSVCRRLRALSHARPLVVVLEDLHWAGPSTIDLLAYAATRLEHAPVLFVATLRSDELAGAHPLRALRRQLRGAGNGLEIALGRLRAPDATRAARAALPETVDDGALARAVAFVDGIPLLLVEAVRDLAAGRTPDASNVAVLVGERLNRLTPDAATAIFFGATLGERFDLDIVEAVTGWRGDDALDAIGELIDCGLVRATARVPALSFSFTHDLIRVAAIDRMAELDRIRANGLIARALLSRNAGNDAGAVAIARHFSAAGETVRAAEQYRRGARYALSVFANEDACANASAGLALCEENGERQSALRYDLLDLREQGLARIGATEARRADARQLVTLANDAEMKAVALDRLFEAYRQEARGRGEALELLAGVASSSPRAARIHAYASARHAYLEGRYREARDEAVRAAASFEREGDARAATRVEFLGVKALKRLGALAEARAETERLRTVVEATDDIALRGEFHLMASDALAASHQEEALIDARRAVELALRIGDRWSEALARHNVGHLLSAFARYEEALTEDELALAAYRDVGDYPGINDLLLNISALCMNCGDFARSQRLLDEIDATSTPYLALRCRFSYSILATGLRNFEAGEREGLEAERQAVSLGATYYAARIRFQLAIVLALQARYAEAKAYVELSLAGFSDMVHPEQEAEALAFGARLYATMGDAGVAREYATRATSRLGEKRFETYGEMAWNLSAAYALLGEETTAESFARESAAAAIDDALRMPADLAETYLRLPWCRHAVAFLWGRPVPLAFGDVSDPA